MGCTFLPADTGLRTYIIRILLFQVAPNFTMGTALFRYNQPVLPFSRLAGVHAAVITPLDAQDHPSSDDLVTMLHFLAGRGCHGALIFGTTGEGPSFSVREKLPALQAALSIRQDYPEFHLLAGTGSPSLDDSVQLTRAAFELGFDGVVLLPPYFFRKAGDDGLFAWYSQVIQRSVPRGGAVLGYHIPGVSGVPLSLELLARLKDAFPDRFAGLKDSSADPEQATSFGERFGEELLIFNGTDALFSHALAAGASGCITALANLFSPLHRQLWEAQRSGGADPGIQELLNQVRAVLDRHPPAPPLIKAMLRRWHNMPRWSVTPPLLDLAPQLEEQVAQEFASIPLPVNIH